MKTLFRTILLSASIALCACQHLVTYRDNYIPEDQLPNTAAPVIDNVYAVGDTAMLQPLAEAKAGQMIRLTGRNLNEVLQVRVGAAEVDVKQVYAYSTGAVLSVPEQPADSDPTQDKLVYTTSLGSATAPFMVRRPAASYVGDYSTTEIIVDSKTKQARAEVVTDAESGVAPIGMPHIHLTGALEQWDWCTIDLTTNNVQDSRDFSDLSQYTFSFDVLTPAGHSLENADVMLQMNWSGTDYLWLSFEKENTVNTAGEWQSVHLPLEQIAVKGVIDEYGRIVLRWVFKPSVEGFTLDYHFANFRIEEK
ncbi:MAG: glycan-binding surface protein [Paludibacteraceae bacterium]